MVVILTPIVLMVVGIPGYICNACIFMIYIEDDLCATLKCIYLGLTKGAKGFRYDGCQFHIPY